MRSRHKLVRPRSFRPLVEALEDRWVPACTVTFSATGVTITGDNAGNVVTISDTGTGAVGSISVTCDGVTTSNAVLVTAFAITADTLGGKDTVVYNLTNDLLATQSRSLTANLGDKNDQFTALSSKPAAVTNLIAGTSLSFNVQGQDGNDSINFNFSQGLQINAGANLSVFAKGNKGNDRISLQGSLVLVGNATFNLNGNQGQDRVAAYLDTVGNGTAGTVTGQVNGQGDADLLALVVNRVNILGTITAIGSLDGGVGLNSGIASNFVSVERVANLFRLPI